MDEPSVPPRAEVLRRVAELVVRRQVGHPTRVAVDGITAAGKSTFAAELSAAVTSLGGPAVHLSTDDFHHVAAYRRRDPDRALGYYRDAYDLAAFRRLVLEPLGPGGDRWYRTRTHDLDTDDLLDAVRDPPWRADPDAVVVVDGSFLQAAPLQGCWDVVVWLEVSHGEVLRRAVLRDSAAFGGADATVAAYVERYHAACQMYVDEHRPAESADLVVDNDDLGAPRVVRVRERHGAR